MTPRPPGPGTLARGIADRYAARIRAGEWPPGTRLPSVRDVEDTEGVARQTAHTALRCLVDDGLAVAVPGSGIRVADPLPAETPRPLSLEERVAAVERRLDEAGL